MAALVLALLFAGCSRNEAAGGPPVEAAPEAEEATPGDARAGAGAAAVAGVAAEGASAGAPAAPATEPPPPLESSAEDLYAACRDRVEGREVAGECASDEDCVAAGCSGEVCVSRAAAEGLVSTCEIRPCFAVLDACTCQAGTCRWTLREAATAPVRVVPRPPGLQQREAGSDQAVQE